MNPLNSKTSEIRQKVTEDELKLVKLVIQDFLQALKTFHLYEADHPILLRFLDRLKKDFDRYFEKYDALFVELDERHFLYDGKTVYESQDLRESLAFMFFKDGIRELHFFKGLDRDEILDFLTIVRKSNVVNRMEDDLVTLFWSKDFVHIDFTIIDDFFEGESILIPLTEEDLIKGLEYRGFEDVGMEPNDKKVEPELGNGAGSRTGFGNRAGSMALGNKTGAGAGTGYETGSGRGLGKGAGAGTKDGAGIGKGAGSGIGEGTGLGKEAGAAAGNHPGLVVEGLRQVVDLSRDKSLAQVCGLTPDEIEEIYRRANKEEHLETLYALINNFTEILLHLGEDTKTYGNIFSYFDRIIKSLLEEGEIQNAVTILKNFCSTMSKISLKEKQNNTVEHILQIASDARSIELLGKAMRQNNEADGDPIAQYLQLLTQQAIDPLCLMLGTLDVERWRKMVRERLAELCGGTIAPLVKFLSSSKASFVTDLLYILGNIQHLSTLTYLTHLASHENDKIREEVFRLATVLKEGQKGLLQKFLRDPLPEIRGKAALIFGKMEGGQTVRQLEEIILSKDFHTRSSEEKISFFTALGETGSERAIPVLEKIIKTKKWFDKGQWEDMRRCASFALRMIETRKG